jgi:hypothetical protein
MPCDRSLADLHATIVALGLISEEMQSWQFNEKEWGLGLSG